MNHATGTKIILLFGDLLLLYGALAATLALRYWGHPDWEILAREHIRPFTATFLVWLFLFGAFGLYEPRFMKNSKYFLYRLLHVMGTNVVIAILIFYLAFEIEPRRNLLLIALFAIVSIFLWRSLFNIAILKTAPFRILFFGINKDVIELADYLLQNPQLRQKPIAFMSSEEYTSPTTLPLPHFTAEQPLGHIVKDSGIDTIVISREIKENKTLVNVLFQVVPLGISIIEFPAFFEMLTGKIPLSLIGEVWFLENLVGARKQYYTFFKRAVDLVLAAILSIATTMLFPFVALAIALSTPRDILHYRRRRARPGDGIIFFRQKRVGKNGRVFDVVKFRSQVLGAEKMGEAKHLENDPRQYPVGRFLRTWYLDELPQIWNILNGEMSLIGPRPERPEYVARLKQKIPFYEMRLLVPPGITGWAQINMENDASVEDAPEKMQYDLYYIKNRSPILDLLIMLRTFFTILRRKGR